jgi:hypothetical protein
MQMLIKYLENLIDPARILKIQEVLEPDLEILWDYCNAEGYSDDDIAKALHRLVESHLSSLRIKEVTDEQFRAVQRKIRERLGTPLVQSV